MIPKPGKKKKKKAVSDRRRFSILTDDLETCYACGAERDIELHEIYFGSQRERSKEYGLVVPLCPECHKGTYGVHGNQTKKDLGLERYLIISECLMSKERR